MKKYKRYTLQITNDGFTLVETIFSFLVSSLCLVLLAGFISLLPPMMEDTFYIEDRIGILQVRTILAQSRNIRVFPTEIQFQFQKEEVQFRLLNQKLVKQVGYEIFLQGIEDSSFYMQNGCIYLQYTKNEKTNEVVLYCE